MSARSASSGVELGGLEREVVVELGQSLLAHLAHLDLELRVLAGEVLGAVLLGEGDLDLALVAGAGAGEAFLEALDEASRAELDELVAALAALEELAVDRALVVHQDEVALAGLALHRVQR